MKNMGKELDEVKNAMKGKTMINLDGMIKRTDSPFTASVLESPWQALNRCHYLFSVFSHTRYQGRPSHWRGEIAFYQFSAINGDDRLSINKPLNSLLNKFLRTDGLNHNYAARLGGDGLTNLSTNSQCARIEETKWRLEAENASRGHKCVIVMM